MLNIYQSRSWKWSHIYYLSYDVIIKHSITIFITGTSADNVKFLFDSEDLLETGVAMEGSNAQPSYTDRYIGLIKLNLGVPKLEQIIERFRDLACTESQFGLDEGHLSGEKMLFILYTTRLVDGISSRAFIDIDM